MAYLTYARDGEAFAYKSEPVRADLGARIAVVATLVLALAIFGWIVSPPKATQGAGAAVLELSGP